MLISQEGNLFIIMSDGVITTSNKGKNIAIKCHKRKLQVLKWLHLV